MIYDLSTVLSLKGSPQDSLLGLVLICSICSRKLVTGAKVGLTTNIPHSAAMGACASLAGTSLAANHQLQIAITQSIQ